MESIGMTSVLYYVLSPSPDRLPYMRNWKADMDRMFEVSDWAQMAKTTVKMSINMSLIEAV